MKKISMISTALLSSALVACGGGSGSPDKVDLCSEVGATNCNQIVVPSSSSSSSTNSSSSSSVVPPRNNILPISEKFAVDNALQLFTPTYKSLLEPGTEDLNPSFYYSTSGLDAGRIVARNGQLTIGNARMTLGQRLQTTGTHINPDALPADFKVNTTTAPTAANIPTTTTWGELDLARPWKISFCVNEFEALSGSASNQQFMVYVDNNQSQAGLSIHGDKSLVKQLNVTNFVAGKRVEINIPGDVLVDGKSIDSVLDNAGTATSFVQLRVPSAGIVTMSELWVGYQSDKSTEPAAATCAAAARVPGYGVAPAAADPTTAPTAVAGDSQLEVSWTELARATAYQVAYNTSNTPEGVTPVDVAGATTTTYAIKDLTNGTPYYVFYRGKNSANAFTAWSPSVTATPVAALVAPVAPQAPTLVAGDAQIEVSWIAVDGASTYQVAYSETNDPATATAFGDPVSATTATITGLTNGTNYFVFVKAQNTAGDSAYSVAADATPVAPVVTAWLGEVVDLFGASGSAPEGQFNSSDDTSLTLTAKGGHLSSSNRRFYFAHRAITGDFVFTARLASVTATNGFTVSANNSYRYGLLIAESLAPVTAYTDLGRSVEVGFYTLSTAPTYQASRAYKLDVGAGSAQSRSNDSWAVGNYLRIAKVGNSIEIFSSTDGVTFVSETTTTLANANGNPISNTWEVGFYSASGADELTLAFDNISITQ